MLHYSPDRNFACRISTNYTYRGHEVAVLENELIRVSILLSKGTDIYEFLFKPLDIDFMWRAPLGVRHPASHATTPSDESSTWIDHYPGGWQEILPNGGLPSVLNGAAMGLHAEVSNLPWDCAVLQDEPDRVVLKTWVRTTRTPLFLEKTLTLNRDTPILQIHECLRNESEQVIPVMWGHHIAIGEPFLSEDCRIDSGAGLIIGQEPDSSPNHRLAAGKRHKWPKYPDRSGRLVDLSRVPPPTTGVQDQCYLGDFTSGWYSVTDTDRQVGFAVAWPKEIFPFVWFYQMYRGRTGYPWYGRAYTIGLEPFTSIPNKGIEEAVKNHTALVLQPGEEKRSWLTALVHTRIGRIIEIHDDGEVLTEPS